MKAMPAPTHDSVKAKAARTVYPRFGYCLRCGMPWSLVDDHITDYSETGGLFPLCEGCWTLLGHPEARIEYYAALVDHWHQQHPVDPTTRQAIGRAVAAGS